MNVLAGGDQVTMFQTEVYADPFTAGITAGGESRRNDFVLMLGLPYFGEGLDQAQLKQDLAELGRPGGVMDAKDPLVTVTNPLDSGVANPDNRDNAGMTVGFTFLGQFIDHDLTLDETKLADEPPAQQINKRTPRLDLESVYLGGPARDPHLYDPTDRAKFRLDAEAPRDLPRDKAGKAIIGDPRNDENTIISQLHLAFLKFHNQVVDHVRREHGKISVIEAFEEARRLVRWHYQFIVVEQFLSVTLNEAIYADLKANGPKHFRKPWDKMPREFQVAAYRFGHSQIRPGYKINSGFGAPIFDIAIGSSDPDPGDLRGGKRAARRFVEWDTFFDFGTQEVAVVEGRAEVRPKVKPNKRIDPQLSTAMLQLPVAVGTVAPGEINSLATRNLRRHIQFGLPSGQEAARAIGARTVLSVPEAGERLKDNTPLWYYILAEALSQEQGKRLGDTGSRIVGDAIFAFLEADPESYWSKERQWQPTLPGGRNPTFKDAPFTMTDLLTFARVA